MLKNMFQPRSILVTGCAGFIGGNFITKFKEDFPETEIIGVDDLSGDSGMPVEPGFRFYQKSILDSEAMAGMFLKHKPEFVFHFAAWPRVSYSIKEPVQAAENNILGTINLLDLAAKNKVRRFIFSSSAAVYGNATRIPLKEADNCPEPLSPYAVHKLTGEHSCKVASNLFGLDTVSLRYFNVFGPGQYGSAPYSTVISAWLEALYFPTQKQAFVEGDGTQTRDFCFVEDVVRANILAMLAESDFGGQAINVASGQQVTIKEVGELIETKTNRRLKLKKFPAREGDVKKSQADIARAREKLGYEPVCDLSFGLDRTVEWFSKRPE